jgi:hypothetical protein
MKLNVLIIISLVSISTYSQTDCKKFKIGKFQNKENGIVKSVIERNDSIQREHFADKEIELKINWIDDCTYKLKLIWGNDAFWNGRPKDMTTPDLIVHITQVNGNEYLQEAKSIGDEFIYKSNLTKIE